MKFDTMRDSSGEAREPWVIGWDVGGAHLKACLMQGERVVDVAQWACPLWQGLHHLQNGLTQALQRWPQIRATTAHAVTMSGEMVDLFADREEGVHRISETLQIHLPGRIQLYAGPGRWVAPLQARAVWPYIASANWLATAEHTAAVVQHGLLIDIGSTTTDIIAMAAGRVLGHSLGDRHRLASGELVYHGVVRTPLCALTPRIPFQGETLNVMNEWFATSADVYRLTGELDPLHDQHPTADGGDKSIPATLARLARMIGCDARDASQAEWLHMARAWRDAQVRCIADNMARVLASRGLSLAGSHVVAAGCGSFLVPDLLTELGWSAAHPGGPKLLDYGRDIAKLPRLDTSPAWASVCAPCVAVASLWSKERLSNRRLDPSKQPSSARPAQAHPAAPLTSPETPTPTPTTALSPAQCSASEVL